ncbi:MAG: elongation factor G, partial [Spirochaetota bacterium]
MSKEYTIGNLRNVALIGHSQTGKTSLVESLLFHSGAIKEMGNIDKGTMSTDYEEEEIERKMSIRNGVTHTNYKDLKINFVDTPGLSDFSADVRAGLRVCETALALVDAESGLEIQTRKNWYLADKYKIARAILVTKMDKERADFQKVVEEIETTFEKITIPIHLPIGKAENIKGVVDILTMKAYYPDGKKVKIEDIPDDMVDQAEEIRTKLIESACETDEALMEKYFEEETLSEEEIYKGLKTSLKEQNFIPVLCTSVINNVGIHPTLDFLVNLMPDPELYGEVEGKTEIDSDETIKRKVSADEPFSGFVFKTMIDPYAGRTSFVKINSGKVRVGDEVFNPTKEEKNKLAHIYLPQGKEREDTSEAIAGDIIVIAKLEKTQTGDTLCDSNNITIYDPLQLPSPVNFTAVRATDKKGEEKLGQALQRAQDEDPSLKVVYNEETRQTVIESNGQLQTEIALRKIEAKNNIKIERSTPRVGYRETIKKKAQASYRHKKQTGGHGQFGEVHIEVDKSLLRALIEKEPPR